MKKLLLTLVFILFASIGFSQEHDDMYYNKHDRVHVDVHVDVNVKKKHKRTRHYYTRTTHNHHWCGCYYDNYYPTLYWWRYNHYPTCWYNQWSLNSFNWTWYNYYWHGHYYYSYQPIIVYKTYYSQPTYVQRRSSYEQIRTRTYAPRTTNRSTTINKNRTTNNRIDTRTRQYNSNDYYVKPRQKTNTNTYRNRSSNSGSRIQKYSTPSRTKTYTPSRSYTPSRNYTPNRSSSGSRSSFRQSAPSRGPSTAPSRSSGSRGRRQ